MSPILKGVVASQISGHLVTNSYESIQTVTVGAGGQAAIDFTSILSTYTHLQIRYIAKSSSSSQNMSIQMNGDTGASYAWHYLSGNGTSASAGALASASAIILPVPASSTNCVTVGVIDILDYANSNKYKTVRTLSGYDQNGSGDMALLSGFWQSTAAITSLKFNLSTNWTQYSQFALYGVK